MLLPIILGLIGAISATPDSVEFKSNFEFLDTNLAEPNYRLLDNVQPTYLNIALDVYLPESRFNGLAQIVVNVSTFRLYHSQSIIFDGLRDMV